jgi:hypothetical protein
VHLRTITEEERRALNVRKLVQNAFRTLKNGSSLIPITPHRGVQNGISGKPRKLNKLLSKRPMKPPLMGWFATPTRFIFSCDGATTCETATQSSTSTMLKCSAPRLL